MIDKPSKPKNPNVNATSRIPICFTIFKTPSPVKYLVYTRTLRTM